MSKRINDVELIEMRRNANTFDEFITSYRDASKSEAKVESLRSALTNRIAKLRKAITASHGEEAAQRILPRFKPVRTTDNSALNSFVESIING